MRQLLDLMRPGAFSVPHGLSLRLVLFLASCGAVAASGCATTRQSIGGWFGEATPTPVSGTAGQSVYYAATEGLTMYSEPSASSKVVGRLSLHERVTRTRLEHGYAYVESNRGQQGWVNNALLIWRLPSAAAGEGPAIDEPAVPLPQGEQPADETTAPDAKPSAVPTNTPAPGSTEAQEAPAGVAPSIFDAY